MSSIPSMISAYSITGNPTLDAFVLAYLMTHITAFISLIQTFISTVVWRKIREIYIAFKRRFLGTVDDRISVSQESSIYPTIRNIFFSSMVKSDDIDIKTLGILNLIT